MPLAKFILRRTLLLLMVIFGVTTITFFLSHVVLPDPARAWIGTKPNPTLQAALEARYHFNDPLYVQYFYYIRDVFTGNWGLDPDTGQPIVDQIGYYLPTTAELAIIAMIITMVLAIPLGLISAFRRNRATDLVIRIFYLTGTSIPSFFLALAGLLTLSYYLKLFPTTGQVTIGTALPPRITGMIAFDALLSGRLSVLADNLQHMVLPSMVLAFGSFGWVLRLVRSSSIQVLESDYIRTARIKGLKERVVMFKHTLRNALIPATTVLSLTTASFLTGSLFVERVFTIPGIGLYATTALLTFKVPAVIAITFLFTVIVVLMNLVADILYAVLDPRITLD